MNTPYNTDHAFVADGHSPYCLKCELLSWMHSPQAPLQEEDR